MNRIWDGIRPVAERAALVLMILNWEDCRAIDPDKSFRRNR